MLPLNTTSCPLFTLHGYLVNEAASFNATHMAEELGSPHSALAVGIVFASLGLVGLLFGARLVRPTLVVVCTLVGALVAQAALFNIDAITHACPCLVGAGAVAVAALAAALLGIFLLNFAFFVGGAALGAGLVATFFAFFPELDQNLAGLGEVDGHGILPYWAAALVAALAFGLLLLRKKEQQAILILLTSFVGAVALATGAEMVSNSQQGPTVPREASAGVVLGLFLLGAGFQAWRIKKTRRAPINTVAYVAYTDNERSQRLLRP